MVVNVSRYVTVSSSGFSGGGFVIGFALGLGRVPERDGPVRGLCIVTSLDVLIICSMPSFQLVQALLMRRRASGVRGIKVTCCAVGSVERGSQHVKVR